MEDLEAMMSNMTGTDFDAMLNDASAWGDPEPAPKKKSEKRQRGAMVSVRLTPEELAHVQKLAAEHGMPVAAYMRDRAIRADVTNGRRLTPSEQFVNATATQVDTSWITGCTLDVTHWIRSPSRTPQHR